QSEPIPPLLASTQRRARPLAVEPGQPFHLQRLAVTQQLPLNGNTRNGVVIACEPRLARLTTETAVAVENRLKKRPCLECELVTSLCGMQGPSGRAALTARCHVPIIHPHPQRRNPGPCQPHRPSRQLLCIPKSLATHVGNSEVPNVDLARTPSRCTLARSGHRRGRRRGSECKPEKGQLKPESLAIGRIEIPGEVPPLL